MIIAVRRIQFCAGHRLCGHDGSCANIHGHNYLAYFHVTAEEMDEIGRLVDFSVLKERLGGWIDEHWDHGFICHSQDTDARQAMAAIPGQKVFLIDRNPTAENLADYLLRVVGPEQLAGTGVRLVRVVLWETENCCAEAAM